MAICVVADQRTGRARRTGDHVYRRRLRKREVWSRCPSRDPTAAIPWRGGRTRRVKRPGSGKQPAARQCHRGNAHGKSKHLKPPTSVLFVHDEVSTPGASEKSTADAHLTLCRQFSYAHLDQPARSPAGLIAKQSASRTGAAPQAVRASADRESWRNQSFRRHTPCHRAR